MNIIFFTHPTFFGSQSMPRYARMLAEGMREKGHKVEVWTPDPVLVKFPVKEGLKKWLGYADQYLLFPGKIRWLLKACPLDTLFVFTDHALGPWVPLVAGRPHVVHCHDFLAQRSALGEIPENPVSWTGKKYQNFIRRGFSKGKNFISVSNKTKEDLDQFLSVRPFLSEVVFNGMNNSFQPQEPSLARIVLSKKTGIDLSQGYLLHVGGNQWYKNRKGVIEIYNAWRSTLKKQLPILLIGSAPNQMLYTLKEKSPFKDDIYFLSGLEDEFVQLAYAGASVFLFPSLAEGFGWPVAEAMASGCPVITTDETPMSLVAGNAGFLIPRRPRQEEAVTEWATSAAKVVEEVLMFPTEKRKAVVAAGLINAKRFDTKKALDRIEEVYRSIIETTLTI